LQQTNRRVSGSGGKQRRNGRRCSAESLCSRSPQCDWSNWYLNIHTLTAYSQNSILLNGCIRIRAGITANVKVVSSTGVRDTLPIALLYAPVQAAPADRGMIADPTTACSRLMPFLVGSAEGLAHLHRSHVLHGNVSVQFMLVGNDRLGLIATGPPSCIRATAPESLASNHYSTVCESICSIQS